MNLRIIRVIVMKDLVDVLKNKSLALVMLVPVFVSAIYMVMNLAAQAPDQVLAYNPAGVPVSAMLRLAAPNLTTDDANSAAAVRSGLADKNSHYSYGVVIPANAIADLKSGKRPALAIYVNGAKVQGYLEQQRAIASFFDYFQIQAGIGPNYQAAEVLNAAATTSHNYAELVHQNGALFGAIALVLVPIGVGIYILPGLLVEEKEKKTIRLLFTSPARSLDVVIAKSLVSYFYTIALSLIIALLFINYISDFTSLLLFIGLGNLFAASIGIIFGAYFNDIQTMYTWAGVVGLMLMWPIFFAMPFLHDVPVLSPLAQIFPSYYITRGLYRAANGDLDFATGLLYTGLLAAFTIAAFLVAAWTLRRRTIFV